MTYSPSEIKQIALRLLAQREHSCFELQRKLAERGCDPELIVSVLQILQKQGLQSDARFTEMYIRSRVNKGYGQVRIEMELAQRGIKEELMTQYLASMDEKWLELAKQVRQKRFGKLLTKDFNERAKEMRFLQYRGFTTEQIRKIFKDS